MATHSSILAWRTPRTEEPGGLLSMGSKESNTTERLHFHFLFVFNSVRVLGFPGGSVVQSLPASAGDAGDSGLIPGSGRFPWSRKWQPAPIFLPGKFHGQRSLVGYSPRVAKNQTRLSTARHTEVLGTTPEELTACPEPRVGDGHGHSWLATAAALAKPPGLCILTSRNPNCII